MKERGKSILVAGKSISESRFISLCSILKRMVEKVKKKEGFSQQLYSTLVNENLIRKFLPVFKARLFSTRTIANPLLHSHQVLHSV